MSKIIAIASGKGGVGKTTITANLGITLANMGKKVLLVDTDFGLNNLDVAMGLENHIIYDIGDIIAHRCTPRDAVVEDSHIKGLKLLSATRKISDDVLNIKTFKSIIDEVSGIADFVLLDCPAGVDAGFNRAVSIAEEVIIVTTPHIAALRDADKVINLLSTYDVSEISLIVNRIRADLVSKGEMPSAEEIAKLLNAKLLGMLPDDDAITIKTAIDRNAKRSSIKAYSNIALSLVTGALSNKKRNFFDIFTRRKTI